MSEYLDPIFLDYEQSFKEFKELITTDYELDSYPPMQAKNQTFGSEFPGALIHKPLYENCTFVGSIFDAADGSLSRFHNCQFFDCFMNNCDFRYCNIFHSTFSTSNKFEITSCNFSYGGFKDSSFSNIHFSGCSFRQMQFENTNFKHCLMQYSSIEQSNIRNCSITHVDFSKVGVRYNFFEKVNFKEVTFHILDLARNFGLIQLLQMNSDEIKIAYGNGKEMSLSEALPKLRRLIPYYLETQQFYELLNVYAAFNEHEKIINTLPLAFRNVVASCDFAALQDLCALVVKFNICTNKQLQKFYTLIRQLIVPRDFPHYLLKSYNTYIENIKHILVNNPYENPEAYIVLKTDIETLSDMDMSQLLMSIEVNIHKLAPNADTTLQLTRHSPYDIIIVLYGMLPEILNVCQAFYYTLGGVKSYSDLKKSSKERTDRKDNPANHGNNIEEERRIELSIGKNFSFKKEYTKRVKSMEYTIN